MVKGSCELEEGLAFVAARSATSFGATMLDLTDGAHMHVFVDESQHEAASSVGIRRYSAARRSRPARPAAQAVP